MTTNYRSSAHNQKIELIFVIFACRRPAGLHMHKTFQNDNIAMNEIGAVQLFFGTWKREVFEEKKNRFQLKTIT